ncbi:hypothetical protein [Paracoccus sp. (in: a-proteobacteria)]|uniref:hypothetical protein n=1 Tax=Paracoccus sp. TaxID=267 RepID=UPI0028A7BC3F|nr:hypothetical protein [Paracoccus sp. (in: a-proteobacteria)]
MSNWMDFSDAEEQSTGDLIPHKTPVKVRMKIRAGSHNDPERGWTGGYATRSDKTGSVYLDCEFTMMGGKYNKRKVWSFVGLHSSKGPKWEAMGRSFIRAALESARGVRPNDSSELALKARQIGGLGDLDGLEFAALVEIQKAEEGSDFSDRNVIQTVLPVTHKDYADLMNGQGAAPAAVAASKPASTSGTPAWAS